MKVASAQLAGDGRNADRVFVTDNAVVVLDGASAHEPVDLDPGDYAQALGAVIADQLDQDPTMPIADAVSTGIDTVTKRFDLTPGRSPSSTVSTLRVRDDAVDLYVLGDTPIFFGADEVSHVLTDERLATVAHDERTRYIGRLRAGYGYDEAHQAGIAALQRAQRAWRNRTGGYWIAETDATAAYHAVTATRAPDEIEWVVLATDGAADVINYFAFAWSEIARLGEAQLADLLHKIADWEAVADPNGIALPRAKCHDDKTLVAVSRVLLSE